MICFRFSSGSSGKIKIGSQDLLDDPILLEEIVDDILTSVLGGLTRSILEKSPEELLETQANGIGGTLVSNFFDSDSAGRSRAREQYSRRSIFEIWLVHQYKDLLYSGFVHQLV